MTSPGHRIPRNALGADVFVSALFRSLSLSAFLCASLVSPLPAAAAAASVFPWCSSYSSSSRRISSRPTASAQLATKIAGAIFIMPPPLPHHCQPLQPASAEAAAATPLPLPPPPTPTPPAPTEMVAHTTCRVASVERRRRSAIGGAARSSHPSVPPENPPPPPAPPPAGNENYPPRKI